MIRAFISEEVEQYVYSSSPDPCRNALTPRMGEGDKRHRVYICRMWITAFILKVQEINKGLHLSAG